MTDSTNKPSTCSRARAPAAAIDELEMMRSLLEEQQRLAQAGLITGALAHDVDNHAQVISGATYLALRRDDPEEWRRALESIQERCCALSEISRTFLGFLRRRESHGAGAFDLKHALHEVEKLIDPLVGRHKIGLVVESDTDANLMGERRLLVQAILNLATNAVRALAGRPNPRLRIEVCVRGAEVRIDVVDNGPGIPKAMRQRLFRPLTTTDGNGLGLFVVRQNVRRLGGSIRVETSDRGTRFSITVPRF